MKERIIIYSLIGLLVLCGFSSYFICKTIQQNTIYTNPATKIIVKTKTIIKIDKNSNTTINVTSGTIRLLPDGVLEAIGSDIKFTEIVHEATVINNSTNVQESSTPTFPPEKTAKIGITMNVVTPLVEFGVCGGIKLFNTFEVEILVIQRNWAELRIYGVLGVWF